MHAIRSALSRERVDRHFSTFAQIIAKNAPQLLSPPTRVTSPAPRDADQPSPSIHTTDLGFGRVVAQSVRGRFLNRDGKPNSVKYGLGAQRAARLYLTALDASWSTFLVWMMGVLLLINGCFALVYLALGNGALRGTEQLGLADPFLAAFSFSVGVFTTTGTGLMHAFGPTANWLVNLESFVGPITLVVAFGLLIARLTRPRMRIGFSESAVIAPYEEGRGLMFRIVNLQPGELSDVQARVNLIRYEDIDGVRQRNFHQLALERSSVEFFTLHWTVVHPITADSPLAGATPMDPALRRNSRTDVNIAADQRIGGRKTKKTRSGSRSGIAMPGTMATPNPAST